MEGKNNPKQRLTSNSNGESNDLNNILPSKKEQNFNGKQEDITNSLQCNKNKSSIKERQSINNSKDNENDNRSEIFLSKNYSKIFSFIISIDTNNLNSNQINCLDRLKNSLNCENLSQKKKLALLISVIVLVLVGIILAIVIPLSLTGNQHLIFERSFGLYDNYKYTRQGDFCVTVNTKNSNPIINCRKTVSDFSFTVLTKSDYLHTVPFQNLIDNNKTEVNDNLEKELDIKLITLMLHLKEMKHDNGTDITIPVSSIITQYDNIPSNSFLNYLDNNENEDIINRIYRSINLKESIKRNANSRNIHSTRYYETQENENILFTNSDNNDESDIFAPIIIFQMFENGTLYKMYKPAKISDEVFSHMTELIEDYSPNLSKKAYTNYNKKNSTKYNNFDLNFKANLIPDKDGEFYGTLKVKPNYSKSEGSNLFKAKKKITTEDYLDFSFPETAEMKAEVESKFNKSTGILESSTHIANSLFAHNDNHTGAFQEDDSNYFSDNYDNFDDFAKTDFSNTNFINNTGLESIKVSFNSENKLYNHTKNDKNTTAVLAYLAFNPDIVQYQEVDLTKLNENKNSYFFNKTLDREIEENKVSSNYNNSDKNKGLNKFSSRILSEDQSISDLKKNKIIVYPAYQFGFFGFKSNMDIGVELKAYENKIHFFVYLKVEGIFNSKVLDVERNVEMKDSIDKMIDFLFKSKEFITSLNSDINNFLRSDLLKELVNVYNKISSLVSLPFNVESLLNNQFIDFKTAFKAAIKAFSNNINQYLDEKRKDFNCPLENYENTFDVDLDANIIEYVDNYSKEIGEYSKEIVSDLDTISTLAASTETTVYLDMVNDLEYFLKETKNIFNSEFENKLNYLVTPQFIENIKTMISEVQIDMNNDYKNVEKYFETNDYQKALSKEYNKINYIFSEENTKATDFYSKYPLKKQINFDPKVFDPLQIASNNLFTNVETQNNKTIDVLKSRQPGEDPLLKQYDEIYNSYVDIVRNLTDIIETKIPVYINFPYIEEVMSPVINDYLEDFDKFIKINIEDTFRKIITKKKIEADTILNNVKDSNKKMKSIIQSTLNSLKISNVFDEIFKSLLIEIEYLSNKNAINNNVNILIEKANNITSPKENINPSMRQLDENDNLISCQEVISNIDSKNAYLNEIINTKLNDVTLFKKELSNYLSNVSNEFITLIDSFNDKNSVFNKLNNIEDIPIDAKREVSDIITSITNFMETNLSEKFDNFKLNLKNLIDFTEISNKVKNALVSTTIINCQSKDITPIPALAPKSQCLIFELTKSKFDELIKDKAKTIEANCLVKDDYTNSFFNKEKIITALTTTHPSIVLLNDDLTYNIKPKMNQIINNISSSTINIQKISFGDLSETFKKYADFEKEVNDKTIFDKMLSNLKTIYIKQGNISISNIINEYIYFANYLQEKNNKFEKVPEFYIQNIQDLLAYLTNFKDTYSTLLTNELVKKYSLNLNIFLYVRKMKFNKYMDYFVTRVNNFMPFILKYPLTNVLLIERNKIAQIFDNFMKINEQLCESFKSLDVINMVNNFNTKYSAFIATMTDINQIVKTKLDNFTTEKNLIYEYNSYEIMKNIFLSIDSINDSIKEIDYSSGNIIKYDWSLDILKTFFEKNLNLIEEEFLVVIKEKEDRINNVKLSTNQRFSDTYTESVEDIITLLDSNGKTYIRNAFLNFAEDYSEFYSIKNTQEKFYFEQQFNDWLKNITFTHTEYLNKYQKQINLKSINHLHNFQETALKLISNEFTTLAKISQQNFASIMLNNINYVSNNTRTAIRSIKLTLNPEEIIVLNNLNIDIDSTTLKDSFEIKYNKTINIILNDLEFSNQIDKVSYNNVELIQNEMSIYLKNIAEALSSQYYKFSKEAGINEEAKKEQSYSNVEDIMNDQETFFTNLYLKYLTEQYDKLKEIISYYSITYKNSFEYTIGGLIELTDDNKFTIYENDFNFRQLLNSRLMSINANQIIQNSASEFISDEIKNVISVYNSSIKSIETIFNLENNAFAILENEVNYIATTALDSLLFSDRVFDVLNLFSNYSFEYFLNHCSFNIKAALNRATNEVNNLGISNEHITAMLNVQKTAHIDNIGKYYTIALNNFISNYSKYLSTFSTDLKEIYYRTINSINNPLLKGILISKENILNQVFDNDIKNSLTSKFSLKFQYDVFFKPKIDELIKELTPLVTNLTSLMQSKTGIHTINPNTLKIYQLITQNIVNMNHYKVKSMFRGTNVSKSLETMKKTFSETMNNKISDFNKFQISIETVINEQSELMKSKVLEQITPVIKDSILSPSESLKQNIMGYIKKAIKYVAYKIDETGRKLFGITTINGLDEFDLRYKSVKYKFDKNIEIVNRLSGIIQDSRISAVNIFNNSLFLEKIAKKLNNFAFIDLEEYETEINELIAQEENNNNDYSNIPNENEKRTQIYADRRLHETDTLNLQDLYNEALKFLDIVKQSKEFLMQLPSLSEIFKKLKSFFQFCIQGKDIFISQLKDLLYTVSDMVVDRKLDSIKIILIDKTNQVNGEVITQLKTIETSFKQIPDLTKNAAFEELHSRIKGYIQEAKNYAAKEIAKAINFEAFNIHDEFKYPIDYSVTIPVGPVPLKFAIGIDPMFSYAFQAKFEGLEIVVIASVGAGVEAHGSAGVSALLLEVNAYIKGVIAKINANFNFNFPLAEFKAHASLCLNGETGNVRCGINVATGFYFLKPVCKLISVVENVCNKIFGFFGLKFICKLLHKVIKVCENITTLGWNHDLLDYQIVKPYLYQKCLKFN